ncbi:MAG TPA: hypothetical protein PL105_09535 [Caldilineaceae bacterium]|nr:hypothetical protein [Caldilineaceae bacterium]
MALAQFGVEIPQSTLARNLGTIPGVGTPFSAIGRLAEQGFTVKMNEWLGMGALGSALSAGTVVVTAILTSHDLPGWETLSTQHTVLVIAVEKGRVYYHDPSLSWGPVDVSEDAFGLAWSEISELTALITRTL